MSNAGASLNEIIQLNRDVAGTPQTSKMERFATTATIINDF